MPLDDLEDGVLAQVEALADDPVGEPLFLDHADHLRRELHCLWEQRNGNRLSGRLFTEQGGLAGILSHSADDLLDSLGRPQRDKALELLFRLVQVDPEGRRHTRRRMTIDEAIAVAGGGEVGRRLLNRLAGERARDGTKAEGPLHLITISEERASGGTERAGRWVNLIHETLIRSKGSDAGKPQPYWQTLWTYIERNKERAARLERLHLLTREWKDRRPLPAVWARRLVVAVRVSRARGTGNHRAPIPSLEPRPRRDRGHRSDSDSRCY